MSTAIAMVPSLAPHERAPVPEISTTTVAPAASQPSSAASPTQRSTAATATSPSAAAQRPGSISPRSAANRTGNTSPTASRSDASNSKVVIKKEPKSPNDPAAPASRPRPSKLDLSKNKGIATGGAPATSLGLPGRDGLGIQEVGIACLSPGFVTQNPVLKEQLQRSMSVRDQQLKIIEARMHQQPAKHDNPSSQTFPATPGLSNRKKNRPGPIVAPNHGQFRGDRGIQSAPLGHSFAQHHHPYPPRPNPSQYGAPHPSQHPANKLPPISDVFNHGPPPQHAEAYRGQRPLQSPSHPPPPPPPPHHHQQQQQQQQHPGYPQRGERDYKSAEEAQQELAAGRPELLPKIVHYGGHQPPTPPSPIGANRAGHKRVREDYEHGSSPPLGSGPAPRRGPFGAGIDSPRTQQAKRDEFLRLCERAWDLFHS